MLRAAATLTRKEDPRRRPSPPPHTAWRARGLPSPGPGLLREAASPHGHPEGGAEEESTTVPLLAQGRPLLSWPSTMHGQAPGKSKTGLPGPGGCIGGAMPQGSPQGLAPEPLQCWGPRSTPHSSGCSPSPECCQPPGSDKGLRSRWEKADPHSPCAACAPAAPSGPSKPAGAQLHAQENQEPEHRKRPREAAAPDLKFISSVVKR